MHPKTYMYFVICKINLIEDSEVCHHSVHNGLKSSYIHLQLIALVLIQLMSEPPATPPFFGNWHVLLFFQYEGQ